MTAGDLILDRRARRASINGKQLELTPKALAVLEYLMTHPDEAVSRERFLLEAEITGGLEHPGIVPVYALGHAPDGRPFPCPGLGDTPRPV